MANGTTKFINTNNEWVTVDSVMIDDYFSGITAGNTYAIQASKEAEVKVGNAIFDVFKKDFTYVAGTDDLYVKTPYKCRLTILESVTNS